MIDLRTKRNCLIDHDYSWHALESIGPYKSGSAYRRLLSFVSRWGSYDRILFKLDQSEDSASEITEWASHCRNAIAIFTLFQAWLETRQRCSSSWKPKRLFPLKLTLKAIRSNKDACRRDLSKPRVTYRNCIAGFTIIFRLHYQATTTKSCLI